MKVFPSACCAAVGWNVRLNVPAMGMGVPGWASARSCSVEARGSAGAVGERSGSHARARLSRTTPANRTAMMDDALIGDSFLPGSRLWGRPAANACLGTGVEVDEFIATAAHQDGAAMVQRPDAGLPAQREPATEHAVCSSLVRARHRQLARLVRALPRGDCEQSVPHARGQKAHEAIQLDELRDDLGSRDLLYLLGLGV